MCEERFLSGKRNQIPSQIIIWHIQEFGPLALSRVEAHYVFFLNLIRYRQGGIVVWYQAYYCGVPNANNSQ